MRSVLRLLEGDQTIGRGLPFWGLMSLLFAGALAFGVTAGSFAVENCSYFLVWVFMALGLAFMWGLGGTMSFGQTAFFGIGGYCYAILSTNWGVESGLTMAAALLSLAAVALSAAVLGYFVFFGGINGVLVSITTLAVTLGLETFLSQTAGPKWAIGRAELGGFNGISSMPPLTVPWHGDNVEITGRSLYFGLIIFVAITYLALRILANSKVGDAMVAVRESPLRAEALGYDVKAILFVGFVVGSVLAGLSGLLYAGWGQYISPDTMGLSAAALPIIWVAVSGKDLTATMVGTVVLLGLSQALAIYGSQYALVSLALILVVSIMGCPKGVFETLLRRIDSIGGPGDQNSKPVRKSSLDRSEVLL
ncbi:MAG: ABC transporter permease [Xanthobacteraceae bacterium]|nr:ABC transporter permease [Xanthobacteraceae bacterium]